MTQPIDPIWEPSLADDAQANLGALVRQLASLRTSMALYGPDALRTAEQYIIEINNLLTPIQMAISELGRQQ